MSTLKKRNETIAVFLHTAKWVLLLVFCSMYVGFSIGQATPTSPHRDTITIHSNKPDTTRVLTIYSGDRFVIQGINDGLGASS